MHLWNIRVEVKQNKTKQKNLSFLDPLDITRVVFSY